MLHLQTAEPVGTGMPGFLPARRRQRARPRVAASSLRELFFRLIKSPLLARFEVPWHWPPSADLRAWEHCSLRSRSGATLAGLYGTAHTERKGVVVCAHPLRKEAKGYFLSSGRADLFRRNGYDVLLFDFNGFGESSQGDFNYTHDVLAAAQYACERAKGLPVHALGACFGAVWLLGAATLDDPFSAIILEAPLTTMQEFYARQRVASAFFGLLWRLFPKSAAAASPIDCAAKLAGTPQLLLVGGLDDAIAPPDMSRRLYEACNLPRGTRSIWYVERAGHLRAFETAPQAYERRVTEFFAAAGARPTLVW
jgi:alpha-beta hydrolase superfamily lysophospholipase